MILTIHYLSYKPFKWGIWSNYIQKRTYWACTIKSNGSHSNVEIAARVLFYVVWVTRKIVNKYIRCSQFWAFYVQSENKIKETVMNHIGTTACVQIYRCVMKFCQIDKISTHTCKFDGAERCISYTFSIVPANRLEYIEYHWGSRFFPQGV